MHALLLAAALAVAPSASIAVTPHGPGITPAARLAARLMERVTDPAGTPIVEARVTANETNRTATTDAGIGKPVIRGLTSNRVLVLDNGHRMDFQRTNDGDAAGSVPVVRLLLVGHR